MDLIGWIVIGLLAGWLSSLVVPGRQARGCLPNLLVGILGGIVGGFLARELRLGDPGAAFVDRELRFRQRTLGHAAILEPRAFHGAAFAVAVEGVEARLAAAAATAADAVERGLARVRARGCVSDAE